MFFSSIISSALVSAMTLTMVPAGLVQDTTEAPPAVGAEDWHVVSRSSATVFLVDVQSIKSEGGVTSAKLARVPASGEAGDLTHSHGTIDFRCSANQSRPGEEVLIGADGSVEDRINDGYDFDRIPDNSLDSYVKSMVCDGDRSTARYPSIVAFIQAGRPNR